MRLPIRFKVALSIVIIFISLVTSLGFFGSRMAAGRIRDELSARIERAFQAFRQSQKSRFQTLKAEAKGVVNTIQVAAAVKLGEPETVRSATVDLFPNISAEFMAIVGADGQMLDAWISHYEDSTVDGKTVSRKVVDHFDDTDQPSMEKLSGSPMISAVLSGEREFTENNLFVGRRLFQVVAAPVVGASLEPQDPSAQKNIYGALVLGYSLTDALARDLARTTGTDVVLLSGDSALASSLDPESAAEKRLMQQAANLEEQGEVPLADPGSEADSLGVTDLATTLVYDLFSKGRYLYRTGPIKSVTAEGTLEIGKSVVLQSLDAAWVNYWKLGAQMVVIAAAVAVIGIFLLLAGAKIAVTDPIRELAAGTERIAAGDFETKISVSNRDELGDLAQAFNHMTDGLREKFTMQKFVSSATLNAVREATGSGRAAGVDRAGKRVPVTVFFSDIRGFTSFSEKVSPERVIAMLNRYLQRQAEIIASHGGDVDKFVGDEVMAVFKGQDKEIRSVRCAVEIQREMIKINRDDPGAEGLAIGIGLNSGEVVEGAMGSRDRMDFTILGSNVNLGARLCSKAGPGEILLSASTYQPISGTLGPIDTVGLTLKGIEGEVTVYKLMGTGA